MGELCWRMMISTSSSAGRLVGSGSISEAKISRT
jgi:hypothetical protein